MNYAEIIQQGESKTVEFKEILPEGEKIAKSVIAFANTGGGRIFIGVRDDGTIAGVDSNALMDIQDRVANIIYDSVAPNLLPEIYAVRSDNKMLLVIQVAPSNARPHYLRSIGMEKGSYIRLGATNRVADASMLHTLHLQRMNISYDEEVCPHELADKKRCNQLKKILARVVVNKKSFSDIDLHNLRLVRDLSGVNYFTIGAAVLLGILPNAYINCARFAGETRVEFLDRKECTGDVFEQIEQAAKFLAFNLNLGARFEGLHRIDLPEIPPEAIREALVNATLHRDYAVLGRDIRVVVNDSTVEISSPGDFPGGALLDEVLRGRTEIRNRVLARVYISTDYFDQWGTGIARIMEECRKAGLPAPEIIEDGYTVKIKFIRPDANRTQSERKVNANANISIETDSEFTRKMLAHIDKNGYITRAETETLLNLGKTRTVHLLGKLVSEGAIEQIGSSRSTKYIIKQK